MTSPLRQQVNAVPLVHRAFWSFAMTGRVRHPYVWTFADLASLPNRTIRVPIICRAGTPNTSIRLVEWRGIPLSLLLTNVEVDPGASFARVHTADRYSTLLTRAALETAFLILEADSQPLASESGAPARLILPGLLGYKQAKWVERIEWIEQPTGGFWEDRGYSLDGEIGIGITDIQTRTIATGIEFTGLVYGPAVPNGVRVSIDEGDWMPARITSPDRDLTGTTIANWTVQWTPPHSGTFTARVCATTVDNAEHAISHQFRVV